MENKHEKHDNDRDEYDYLPKVRKLTTEEKSHVFFIKKNSVLSTEAQYS